MSSPSAVLSQTLKSITITKFKELNKQKRGFEVAKAEIVKDIDSAGDDLRSRVSRLLSGVHDLDSSSKHDALYKNITRWLEQSRYDPSIPDSMLEKFEAQLRAKLDVQSRKLDLAELYSLLLTEWIESPVVIAAEAQRQEKTELDDDFEVLEKDRLQQLCRKFAAVVFTPLETDEVEIDLYLSNLFEGDAGIKALGALRQGVKEHGKAMFKKTPFDIDTLEWCIRGLLHNTLLNEEKKSILQDFLQNDTVLQEIADVLNMRFADFKNWSWDAGVDGIPVEPRQQLNGKTRIHMDEDLLQAMFLHYIGITWSVALKQRLWELFDCIWKTGTPMSLEDRERWRFYLGNMHQAGTHNVGAERRKTYREDFFMSHLSSSILDNSRAYDADPADGEKTSSHQIKQQLLRQLATEIHVGRDLDGEVAIVQSDLQWYATGLPHSTLSAVMRFIGVPEAWITFFTKFLEAPLNMSPCLERLVPDDRVRVRKRGIPIAHALEVFFGELVLFFMDLAVNQEASMLLYRQHDDLWLCGPPQKCAKAWQTMQDFAKVVGVQFNEHKTGSVYLKQGDIEKDEEVLETLPKGPVAVDFLQLCSETGQWTINQEPVDAHVKQLEKQLAACSSVLSWIQTWNSCIGRFFGSTFGEPANCFGSAHVDNILETHLRMQKYLFSGENGQAKSVTEHLKRWISEKYGMTEVPDAFLLMPEEFGGLGLRDPFNSLFLVHDKLPKDPKQLMRRFFKEEIDAYKAAKTSFDALGETGRRRHFQSIYPSDSGATNRSHFFHGDIDTFMTFEDFTRWRESESSLLWHAYTQLLRVPEKKDITTSADVERALRMLAETQFDLAPESIDSEKKWIVQLHSEELFKQCGGLALVDKTLLPLGVLAVLRKRKVAWQMVL
ncbi:hypothetical protein MMC12_005946 [Toensbergia leucococca]|nr:hypothetical protein [Toensbergia leucococca]